MPRPTETLRIGRLRPSDAGEVLTVQRAAYVTEAQRYAAPHIPPLLETLDEMRSDLARPDVPAVGAWLGARLVGSVRGRVEGPTMEVARLSVAVTVRRGEIGGCRGWPTSQTLMTLAGRPWRVKLGTARRESPICRLRCESVTLARPRTADCAACACRSSASPGPTRRRHDEQPTTAPEIVGARS